MQSWSDNGKMSGHWIEKLQCFLKEQEIRPAIQLNESLLVGCMFNWIVNLVKNKHWKVVRSAKLTYKELEENTEELEEVIFNIQTVNKPTIELMRRWCSTSNFDAQHIDIWESK